MMARIPTQQDHDPHGSRVYAQQHHHQQSAPPESLTTATTAAVPSPSRRTDYRSTQDGDVAVEPSPSPPAPTNDAAAAASAGATSPSKRPRRSRNLSALLLDAATLTEPPAAAGGGGPPPVVAAAATVAPTTGAAAPAHRALSSGALLFQQLTEELNNSRAGGGGSTTETEDRKHRRLFSDESLTTGMPPAVAHRRLDSMGTVERTVRTAPSDTVGSSPGVQPQGLDLLSTAAAKTQPSRKSSRGPRQLSQDEGDKPPIARLTARHSRANRSYDASQPHSGLVQPYLSPAAPTPSALGAAVNYPGYTAAPNILYTATAYGGYNYPAGLYASAPATASPPFGYPTQRLADSLYGAHAYDYLRASGGGANAAAPDNSQLLQQPYLHGQNIPYWDQGQQYPQYTIHKGSQTFVTGLAIGEGNRVLQPSAPSATAVQTVSGPEHPLPAAHHRKLSSFSATLNNVLGTADLEEAPLISGPPSATKDIATITGRGSLLPAASEPPRHHHRKASSSMSFIHGLAGLEGVDETFLRNLQTSNAELQAAYRESEERMRLQSKDKEGRVENLSARVGAGEDKSSVLAIAPSSPPAVVLSEKKPMSQPRRGHQLPIALQPKAAAASPSVTLTPTMTYAAVTAAAPSPKSAPKRNSDTGSPEEPEESDEEDEEGDMPYYGSSKLAAGGTSKRIRRKCSVAGCENRVVQGGLCIAHGAKRKQCKHPGCDKNVKKAGLCSAHGPARKRCDVPGCKKVAVQGGRCIGHGARKKLCAIADCNKQAIINGMCKRHHDLQQGGIHLRAPVLGPVGDSASGGIGASPGHQRGLSIFQEMSADAVSSLLNEEGTQFYH